MIAVGDCVTLSRLPDWVDSLPEETQQVFHFCVGRSYLVIEIDINGLYVLDVSADIDSRFGGSLNDIRLEAIYLTLVPSP